MCVFSGFLVNYIIQALSVIPYIRWELNYFGFTAFFYIFVIAIVHLLIMNTHQFYEKVLTTANPMKLKRNLKKNP